MNLEQLNSACAHSNECKVLCFQGLVFLASPDLCPDMPWPFNSYIHMQQDIPYCGNKRFDSGLDSPILLLMDLKVACYQHSGDKIPFVEYWIVLSTIIMNHWPENSFIISC